MKYYFVNTLYKYGYEQTFKPDCAVTKMHPFEYVADLLKCVPEATVKICNWQEITEDEYRLYKKLEL